MMSLFGWSLPPGCGTLPGEEESAFNIGALTTLPLGVVGVFWDENGNLIEQYPITIPADEYNNAPAYSDVAERMVGVCEWHDEISDAANVLNALDTYLRITATVR
jgi:hypothetical protein